MQNPAEDHLLKAEDKAWGDRPAHGIAHDKAWEQANRQPRTSPVLVTDPVSIVAGEISVEDITAPVARTTVKPAKKAAAKKPAESITPAVAAAAADGSAPTRPKKIYKP